MTLKKDYKEVCSNGLPSINMIIEDERRWTTIKEDAKRSKRLKDLKRLKEGRNGWSY